MYVLILHDLNVSANIRSCSDDATSKTDPDETETDETLATDLPSSQQQTPGTTEHLHLAKSRWCS